MKYLCLCAAIIFPGFAHAGLTDVAPMSACNYLAGIGLKTTTYTRQADGSFRCTSPHINIGAVNNITYYVVGSEQTATALTLAIEVDSPAEATAIHRRLKDVATTLAQKLGIVLPAALLEDISTGRDSRIAVDRRNVSVIRTPSSNGSGYAIKVVFD